MPAFLRFGLAAVSGWLVYLSYEPIGHWWAAVLGIALLWLTLMPWPKRATAALGMAGEAQERPSVRFGALIGFTHGLFCYLFLLPWVGEFVGAMPYIALAITMAVIDGTIAGAALPTIARSFGISPADSIWATNAYQLAVTVSLLPLAALGESLRV